MIKKRPWKVRASSRFRQVVNLISQKLNKVLADSSFKKDAENLKLDNITFNQGVVGSNPTRLTTVT